MIGKFISDAGEIRLRDEKMLPDGVTMVPQENIFGVDSLSLIIGNNGSGKTRILEGIADAICYTTRHALGLEWDPQIFDPNNRPEHYGVVYFSQAPNRRRRKKKSPRYIDAFSTRAGSYSPEDLFGHEELLRDLTSIDPRFIGLMRADARKLLQLLVQLMLETGELLPKGLESAFSSVAAAYREAGDSVKNKRAPVDEVSFFFKGIDGNLDSQIDLFAEHLGILIHDMLGPQGHYAAMVALDHLLRSERCTRDFVMKAFSSILNLPVKTRKADPYTGALFEKFLDYQDKIGALLERVGVDDDRELPYWPVLRIEFEVDSRAKAVSINEGPLSDVVDLEWSNVSAGQWALVTQCIDIEAAIMKLASRRDVRSILVLIDEGDAFLHLEWQRQYIHLMDKLLSKIKARVVEMSPQFRYLQVVIATHSPLLATDVPGSYVNRLHGGHVEKRAASFAAPLQTILNNSFESKSIGEHAADTIRKTIYSLRQGKAPTARDLYVIDAVDDPVIRRELEAMVDAESGSNP